MKKAKMILTYAVLVTLLYTYHNYVEVPAVPAIRVIAPTEQSIREDIKRERLEKQYRNAATAARLVYRRVGCRPTFAIETGRAAVDFGVSPRILAALVFIESSCNPSAVSGRASVGLTQVNPLVWKVNPQELKNPSRNLRLGASILASYVRRFGVVEGLHRYNGLGNRTNSYAEKVLAAAGIQTS